MNKLKVERNQDIAVKERGFNVQASEAFECCTFELQCVCVWPVDVLRAQKTNKKFCLSFSFCDYYGGKSECVALHVKYGDGSEVKVNGGKELWLGCCKTVGSGCIEKLPCMVGSCWIDGAKMV